MQAWMGMGRGAVFAGAVLLFGCAAVSLWVSPAEAQGQTLRLVSPPAVAQPLDTIHVMVSNLGPKPIRVSSLVAEAADLTLIEGGDAEMVAAGTTTFFSIRNESSDAVSFLAVVQVQSPGRGFLRTSLQVIDDAGRTQIFTDGFESGDVSR